MKVQRLYYPTIKLPLSYICTPLEHICSIMIIVCTILKLIFWTNVPLIGNEIKYSFDGYEQTNVPEEQEAQSVHKELMVFKQEQMFSHLFIIMICLDKSF